jgi:hypothetical protein
VGGSWRKALKNARNIEAVSLLLYSILFIEQGGVWIMP